MDYLFHVELKYINVYLYICMHAYILIYICRISSTNCSYNCVHLIV